MTTETLMGSAQSNTDAGTQQGNVDAGAAANANANAGASAAATGTEGQPAANANDSQQKPAGAPETYAAFTLPEGVTLETEVVTELQGLAKDLNLTQEQAQKLADREVKQRDAFATKQADAITAVHEQWATTSKADKEFGGDNLTANLAIAKKAMDKFAAPEMKQWLEASGLGNHPEVIRTFFRIGKAISEDSFVQGGNTPPANRDARSFYPNSQHAA